MATISHVIENDGLLCSVLLFSWLTEKSRLLFFENICVITAFNTKSESYMTSYYFNPEVWFYIKESPFLLVNLSVPKQWITEL